MLTIIITRFNEPDTFIENCLEALLEQTDKKFKVILYDQKNNSQTKFLVNKYGFVDYIGIPAISLSYARNLGVKNAKTKLVSFLDCDAIPAHNRVEEVKKVFSIDKNIGIVGTKIIPKRLSPPKVIHKSSLILEQYSLLNLGIGIQEHRKVVGASFALNKDLLGEITYFDSNLGRSNGKLLGGEETDLCERVIESHKKVMYTGKTFVYHQIQKERISWYRALKRIYWGGYSRALRGGKPSPHHNSRNVYDYLLFPIIILFYGYGYLKGRLEN